MGRRKEKEENDEWDFGDANAPPKPKLVKATEEDEGYGEEFVYENFDDKGNPIAPVAAKGEAAPVAAAKVEDDEWDFGDANAPAAVAEETPTSRSPADEPMGPPRPRPLGGHDPSELRTPEDPSLSRELSRSTDSFFQGATGNLLDELIGAVGMPEQAAEMRASAHEYPWAKGTGEALLSGAASAALPAKMLWQGGSQGALNAASEYADSRNSWRALGAGATGFVAGATGQRFGDLLGETLAKPAARAAAATVDDLRAAYRGPMPDVPPQVPLDDLPIDPVQAALRRQAPEAVAPAPLPHPDAMPRDVPDPFVGRQREIVQTPIQSEPPLPPEMMSRDVPDPFVGRQRELVQTPYEPPPPMGPPGPPQDPFAGRMREIVQTPPEPMAPPHADMVPRDVPDPFEGRAGELARTPTEYESTIDAHSPAWEDPFVEGGAFHKKPENAWWMDESFAQGPRDTSVSVEDELAGLLPGGKARPRFRAAMELPGGGAPALESAPAAGAEALTAAEAQAVETLRTAMGQLSPAWLSGSPRAVMDRVITKIPMAERPAVLKLLPNLNRKSALGMLDMPAAAAPAPRPRPQSSDVPLELAVEPPKRPPPSWTEPAPPADLDLAVDLPQRPQRTWSEPETPADLELAGDVPTRPQRQWSEPEPETPLELATEPPPRTRPKWTEPAPEAPLELASELPARPQRQWSEPEAEAPLELAVDVPAREPPGWYEPQQAPAPDLQFGPPSTGTPRAPEALPPWLEPAHVKRVQDQAQRDLDAIGKSQYAELKRQRGPATLADVAGAFVPGVGGRLARLANRSMGKSPKAQAIESGLYAPNAAVREGVAYGTAATQAAALQAILSRGDSGLDPEDEAKLTSALLKGDQKGTSSLMFLLQNKYTDFAKLVEEQYKSYREDAP
jgi:hypothetical protein